MGMATNSFKARPSTKTGVASSTKFVTVMVWSVELVLPDGRPDAENDGEEDGDDGGDDHHAQSHEEV